MSDVMAAFWIFSGVGMCVFLCCAGIALLLWVIGRDGK